MFHMYYTRYFLLFGFTNMNLIISKLFLLMNEMESLDKAYVMLPAYRNEVLTKTNESLKKKKKNQHPSDILHFIWYLSFN